MEKTERHDNSNKLSTLSVDVEPFVPRQQTSQTSCESINTTPRNQRLQGIPPYITSCYPFVQEDSSGCDYRNTPWSTYVPPQFSFQFSGHQASSAQRCSYSRYPPSQLSPRYNTGFYSQFKHDSHYSWDGMDRNRKWTGGWKYQDIADCLEQQDYNFHDQKYNLHRQGFFNSARPYKPLYRKPKISKDSQKDGSETSSTDLSSQSSSHTRTLGDFFPNMKSVKRSKSLPNSAAKLESTSGKPIKNPQLNITNIELSEWPSPSATTPTEKTPKNQNPSEAPLIKPKSFADIIKTKPPEPKTTPLQVEINTMSSEELRSWNKNIQYDAVNKPRINPLRTGKTSQIFQQSKYYTDISPRCVINATLPKFNESSEMRGSASCSDIRAARTPRNDTGQTLKRATNRPEPKRGDMTPRENMFYPHYDDGKRMYKPRINKMMSAENMPMSRQPLRDKSLTFVHDLTPDNAMNCGERQLPDSNSNWRYGRFRNSNWDRGQQERQVDSKYSKDKPVYPKQQMVPDAIENVEADDGGCKLKKKKKKSSKEKNESRKNQLAAVQGKMVLLSPEMYSKLIEASNRQGNLREQNSNCLLDNDDDYPELGSHLSKESTPRVKRAGSEDDEWSDVDSDYDLVDGILSSPGRFYRSPRSCRGAEAQPLSYSAAVKQSKENKIRGKSYSDMGLEYPSEGIESGAKKKSPKKQSPKKRTTCAMQEVVQLRTRQSKPKKNMPIQLNITEMLNQCEKKKKMKKGKVGFAVNKWSRPQGRQGTTGFPMVANILDSTAPTRRRGKERELPHKKHPSALKKIILREREQRKKLRQLDEQSKAQHSAGSDLEGADSAWETQGSSSSTTASICGGIDDETKKLLVTAASIVHSRRFREYCDHILSPDIDAVVTILLQDLIRFHTRLYHKDPVKAKNKRRVVLGLREVTKHLKLKRLKCIILAPNLDRIRSKGGLDDAIESIIKLAKEQKIPYVFALGRKLLGRVCYKQVPVSCVGIFNYSGSEANFNQLMDLVARAQVEYKELVVRAQMEYQRMMESAVKSEGHLENATGHNGRS